MTAIRRAGAAVTLTALALGVTAVGGLSSPATAQVPVPEVQVSLRADAPAAASLWPAHGQAAYQLGSAASRHTANEHAVPIASVAKMMTAYVVINTHPLHHGSNGFVITVTKADVADYYRRAARDESVVPVRAGEHLTERQALAALLLPSANNVAILLARKVSGSVPKFLTRMNATAHSLGMTHTHYTDPSGFEASTKSTAADQLLLAQRIMRSYTFSSTVARKSYRLPVAGVVHNTDTLLGHDGFIGIKTGSEDASGGCFVFRSVRLVHGHRTLLTGVVLGQPGSNLIAAALAAAKRLVDRVAPTAD
jgi:serine-type D-Ala-D-Ala carboxypeptidase (penicillin-binding protein 5/6)